MVSCEDVAELLSAAIDGELPPEADAAVAAHVAACARCAEDQRRLAEVRSLVRALPARQSPAAVRQNLVAAAHARQAASRPRQLAVATALLAAALAGGAVGALADGGGGSPVPVDELVTEHLATSTPAADTAGVQP